MQKILFTVLVFLTFFGITHLCMAQQESGSPEKVLTWSEGMDCPEAGLELVQWLTGNWEGSLEGNNQQHVVFSQSGTQMPGFARGWTNTGDVMFYEINVFTEVEGCLEYHVKHLSSNLSAWEGQDGYVRHRLVDYSDKSFYFDGITFVKNGSDKHIVYFRIPEGEQAGRIIVVNQERKPL
ncbi:DUF6265 family protein [Rhodohalobacter sp. 614A]|uniref:DUF6265 family protein n=1 Tax=Rhodohalobacter sp. 614A TaxID=2908649 RepID=UPI001F236597|nr:DUF6265 family protein [Rhodohalobacter sp. 614A]